MELKATRYEVCKQVATITLNRPSRLNAWTGRMHTEYRYLLEQANSARDVRAIVITGAGDGFCVGADTKALESQAEKGGYDSGTSNSLIKPGHGVSADFEASFAYHFGLSKPVVAAINGPAAGVGLVLACFADIRFAAPGVKLTTAHGKLNFPAEYGLSWLLPRLIGLSHANDLLLTSRIFMTEEAEKLGLVNRIVERKALLRDTYDYVEKMIETVSPGSLRETRWQIYKDLHRGVASAVKESEGLIETMSREKNFKEGVKALLEKRLPKWTAD